MLSKLKLGDRVVYPKGTSDSKTEALIIDEATRYWIVMAIKDGDIELLSKSWLAAHGRLFEDAQSAITEVTDKEWHDKWLHEVRDAYNLCPKCGGKIPSTFQYCPNGENGKSCEEYVKLNHLGSYPESLSEFLKKRKSHE